MTLKTVENSHLIARGLNPQEKLCKFLVVILYTRMTYFNSDLDLGLIEDRPLFKYYYFLTNTGMKIGCQ